MLRLQVEATADWEAPVHQLYWPGWAGHVDGARASLRPQENANYMQVALPAGAHTLELRYEGTAAEHWGLALSLPALILLTAGLALWRAERGVPVGRVGPEDAAAAYPAPRPWLPILLLLLAGLKATWVDPQTTWLRHTSTCRAIEGAVTQADLPAEPVGRIVKTLGQYHARRTGDETRAALGG